METYQAMIELADGWILVVAMIFFIALTLRLLLSSQMGAVSREAAHIPFEEKPAHSGKEAASTLVEGGTHHG